MRKIYFLFALAPSALIFAACGGDDSGVDGGNDSGGNDSTVKDSSAPDTGSDSSSTDAAKDSATDSGSDVSQISITCQKPADCYDSGAADAAHPPDGGEVCCGTITTSGTSTCSFVSASTACSAPASCTTSFAAGCGTDTARLCVFDSECVETNANPLQEGNKCCTAHVGDGGNFHVCSNTTLAGLSGGALTCP